MTSDQGHQIRHHIGHSPRMVNLRNKYYSDGPMFPVHTADQKKKLTEFMVITDREHGTSYRCLTHPGSYYSPSLNGTEDWSADHWAQLSSSLRSIPNWHICR